MKKPAAPPLPEHVAFLAPYGPRITELVLATRALVLEEAPDATELVYDAYSAVTAGYSFTGRPSDAFCYVAAYETWVNLGFHFGAKLPDPEGLLQGTGRWARHVRIAGMEDVKNPAVRRLLKAAVAEAEKPERGEPKGGSVVRAVYPKKRRSAAKRLKRAAS